MSKITEFDFSDFETKIRSGRGAEVRKFISVLNSKKLSRFEKLKFANLARRVGLAKQAFGFFTRWDYESAEPLLRSYLRQNISTYQQLVGHTNLIAALVFLEKIEEATVLLEELLRLTDATEYQLINSYGLELSGQCQLELKNYQKARVFFEKAGQGAKNSSSNTPFLVRKWLAILELSENEDSRDFSSLGIHSIRAEAVNLRDWESARSCDLQLALITKNVGLAQQVFFGTAHYKFRQKLKSKTDSFFEMPASYDRLLGENTPPSSAPRVFDIETAEESGSEIQLKPGQTLHRLLKVIAADFYKPIRANEIFSLVFANENFDPAVSGNRVHQAIKRLRDWISENEIPLQIAENDSAYSLVGTAPYVIRWPITHTTLQREKVGVLQLTKNFPAGNFTVKEAGLALGISDRTASRLIKTALEKSELQKISSGPSTKYKLAA